MAKRVEKSSSTRWLSNNLTAIADNEHKIPHNNGSTKGLITLIPHILFLIARTLINEAVI